MTTWLIAVTMAIPGSSPDQPLVAAGKEATVNQPQQTDPCAFIRKDIEITLKLIDDDRAHLQHPETLTHDVVVRLKVDLERRGELLDSFQEALHRCRAEHPHCKSAPVEVRGGQRVVAFSARVENISAGYRLGGTDGSSSRLRSPEMAMETGQLNESERRCNGAPRR